MSGLLHPRKGSLVGRIVVYNSVTLDGVMQAPARPDEDTRDGFEHGGWANAYFDPAIAEEVGQQEPGTGAFLFGRRTYEDFASIWPNMPPDNPFAALLNEGQKYVVSRTLREPLPWKNSTLLSGEVPESVARLKSEKVGQIMVFGSAELIRSLMPHGLIDEYQLLVHPLVLGSGRRLFTGDGTLVRLRLVESRTTSTGVIIATYHPE